MKIVSSSVWQIYIHSVIRLCHVSYILVSYSAMKTVARNTLEIIHLFNTASAHQLIWKSCNNASWKRIFPDIKNILRGNEILPAETKYSPRKWSVEIFSPTPQHSSQPKDIPRGKKSSPRPRNYSPWQNYSPRPRKYSPRKNIPRGPEIIPRGPENIPRGKIFPAAQKIFPAAEKIFPAENIFPAAQKIFPAAEKIFPAENIFPAAQKIFPAEKKYSFLCPSQASVVRLIKGRWKKHLIIQNLANLCTREWLLERLLNNKCATHLLHE